MLLVFHSQCVAQSRFKFKLGRNRTDGNVDPTSLALSDEVIRSTGILNAWK